MNIFSSIQKARTFIAIGMLTFTLGSMVVTVMPISSYAVSLSDILTGGEFKNTTGTKGTTLPQNKLEPITLIANVLKYILGFLAILSVSLILYAGFLWMTAHGEKDNVEKAQHILKYALLGLAVILSAWGITQWVFKVLVENIILDETTLNIKGYLDHFNV